MPVVCRDSAITLSARIETDGGSLSRAKLGVGRLHRLSSY